MPRQTTKEFRHNWELKFDEQQCDYECICNSCLIKRRTIKYFVKGSFMKLGKRTEYFIDGKWTVDYKECIKPKICQQ